MATYCLVLLCLPAVGSASSPPADSVHFCAASEYEAWLGDNPRPAGKRAAELNVGEPRTVRMIFFRPARSYFRPKVVDSMKVVIRRVQAFFAENMQAHGYGNRTFRIETDADGEPVVHYVIGQQPLEHYRSGSAGHSTMNEEIGQSFDLQANVYLVVADHIELSGGFGYRSGKNGGYATVGTWWARAGRSYAHIAASFFRVAAHELGHAFGLSHDFRDDTFIMSYGHGPYRLSACAAEYLSVHPYFNSDIPLATESAPTIELISPVRYPGGSLSVSLRFEVGDAEGLHQVILLHPNVSLMHASGYLEVYACRGMAGENEAVVEFEFGPGIALKWRRRIFESKILRLGVRATDTDGNVTSESINLVEVSEHQIAILEGHNDRVTSLAYSPDGTILASGSYDRTIRLWDMAAKEEIAPMEGHRRLVTSVAFSPDGTTLASGSASIRLWDVAAREEIATLEGHSDWVSSVAFSPDGTTLASGSASIRLWDVAAREEIATLEGHSDWVFSVVFSPDGTTLAFGSRDGTVRLWDVAAREEIATLQGHSDWVYSVVFSPDGSTLASGSRDRTIKLWDVVAREEIATLEGRSYEVNSVVFSPDGTTLAFGSAERLVGLWDVLRRKRIDTVAHINRINSVAFSPDGTTLAAGSLDGKIVMWDMSPYFVPVYRSADLDGDGEVGFSDFVKFTAKFGLGRGQAGYDPRYDLDWDGNVGFSDFLIFAGAFGTAS